MIRTTIVCDRPGCEALYLPDVDSGADVLERAARAVGWRRTSTHSHACPACAANTRCPAAHPEDPTPCTGPVVVTVTDSDGDKADGCEHHAARLLASLEDGRVYALPDAPAGTAIRVFQVADGTRPFPWLENAPRTHPSQLSTRENREAQDHMPVKGFYSYDDDHDRED